MVALDRNRLVGLVCFIILVIGCVSAGIPTRDNDDSFSINKDGIYVDTDKTTMTFEPGKIAIDSVGKERRADVKINGDGISVDTPKSTTTTQDGKIDVVTEKGTTVHVDVPDYLSGIIDRFKDRDAEDLPSTDDDEDEATDDGDDDDDEEDRRRHMNHAQRRRHQDDHKHHLRARSERDDASLRQQARHRKKIMKAAALQPPTPPPHPHPPHYPPPPHYHPPHYHPPPPHYHYPPYYPPPPPYYPPPPPPAQSPVFVIKRGSEPQEDAGIRSRRDERVQPLYTAYSMSSPPVPATVSTKVTEFWSATLTGAKLRGFNGQPIDFSAAVPFRAYNLLTERDLQVNAQASYISGSKRGKLGNKLSINRLAMLVECEHIIFHPMLGVFINGTKIEAGESVDLFAYESSVRAEVIDGLQTMMLQTPRWEIVAITRLEHGLLLDASVDVMIRAIRTAELDSDSGTKTAVSGLLGQTFGEAYPEEPLATTISDFEVEDGLLGTDFALNEFLV